MRVRQAGGLVAAFLGLLSLLAPSTGIDAAPTCPKPGPGANLTGCNLAGKNLSGIDLTNAILTATNLTGTNLTGAKLAGVVSGRITGTPSHFPSGYGLARGFIIGPNVV